MSIFDYPGRMVSGSKLSPPGEICVLNANVCTQGRGKIWYGDLNLTKDVEELKALAVREEEAVYVLREMDGRFDNERSPKLERAVAVYQPDGTFTIDPDKRWD